MDWLSCGASVQVYELDSGKWVSHWIAGELNRYQQGIAWSADSQHVATTFTDQGSQKNGVEIHEAATGRLMRSLTFPPTVRDHTGQLYSPFECDTVSWSPDGRWLALAGQLQSQEDVYQVFFAVWDVASGAQVMSTSYASNMGTAPYGFQLSITVCWSPDGKTIAASEGSVVRIWDTTSGQTLLSYRGHASRIRGLSWSSRGDAIASSSLDSIRIWQSER
jgi:WD40 repeat protein